MRRTPERPGPPRPRPALTSAPHAGLRGVMAGSPLPPLGLGVAGRAPGRGRRTRRRTRAHARTHGRAARRRPRRPGAREGHREPGGGGEPPSGREATEGGDGPEAEVAARPALRLLPAATPAASLRSRRFRSPARPHCSVTSGARPRRPGTTPRPRGTRTDKCRPRRGVPTSAAEEGGEGTPSSPARAATPPPPPRGALEMPLLPGWGERPPVPFPRKPVWRRSLRAATPPAGAEQAATLAGCAP